MASFYLAVDTKPFVRVWRFEDAPKEFQALSRNDGDEDWVALIPVELAGKNIPWSESREFGYCTVWDYPLPSGAVVRIGRHA